MGGVERSPTRKSGQLGDLQTRDTVSDSEEAGTSTQQRDEEREEAQEQDSQKELTVEKRYRMLMDYINNELDTSNKLRKGNKEELKRRMTEWAFAQAELVGNITRLEKETEKLEKENRELRSQLENKKETTRSSVSFADIVRQEKTVRGITPQTTQVKHTLFITAKNKNETIKEVQKNFTTNLNPVKERIRIKNIRKTNNTLIVETETNEDLQKIKNNIKLAKDLSMEPIKKRKPLMIMYDVPSGWEEERIKNTIYEQNLEGKISREEFENGFNIRFKTGPREKATVHQVAEVDAKIRKIMIQQERLYMGFYAIRVKDYLVVAKCMKCQDLGHVAKHCRVVEQVCGHCGQKHKSEECKNKEKDKTCIPCQIRHKQCKEKGKNCQTYKTMLERLIEKTDY